MSELEAELLDVIQALDTCVWHNGVDASTIEEWLREFGVDGETGSEGRKHALYLLSRFMYFGDAEVRALLRALYRDHYRYPIIASIRKNNGDTRDEELLQTEYGRVLGSTRFLGMGNPSESGTHLLYHYRQENDLTSRLFISPHEIFDLTQKEPALADPAITRYVFIDDFCGSGIQGVRYSREVLQRIRAAAEQTGVTPTVAYHVLIGTSKGLQRVQQNAQFDELACVLELDESFRAFEPMSRYFRNPPSGIDRETAMALARRFGEELSPGKGLGFDGGQLMLGFFHNTPNNTLPIFWHPGHTERTWHPVFRRYYKISSPVRAKQVGRDHA